MPAIQVFDEPRAAESGHHLALMQIEPCHVLNFHASNLTHPVGQRLSNR